LQTKMIKMRIT